MPRATYLAISKASSFRLLLSWRGGRLNALLLSWRGGRLKALLPSSRGGSGRIAVAIPWRTSSLHRHRRGRPDAAFLVNRLAILRPHVVRDIRGCDVYASRRNGDEFRLIEGLAETDVERA